MSDDTKRQDQNRPREITISKRLVVINSISSVLSKLINMTVLFWMYQYLLNRISAEQFAVLPVVMILILFAPLFFSVFTGGISRYVVEAYANGDFDQITVTVSSIFPPMALTALVFLGAGTVFALNIDHVFNVSPDMHTDVQIMMTLLVISFCLQMLGMPFSVGFHVLQRFVELNLLGIARDLIRIVLLLSLLIGIGPQVIWVVVATAASESLHTLALFVRSRQMVPELSFRRSAFQMDEAMRLLNFGVWTTLGRLGNVMYTNAATLLLNLFGTAVDVTAYHIGATFFRQLESIVHTMMLPTQTVLTAMHTSGDNDRFARLVFLGGRYALWVSLLVAIPLSIFADDFVALYLDAQYATTALVIVFFMLNFPFTCPTAMLAMAAIARAEVRRFFLPAFLFQFAGLVLMVLAVTLTDLGAAGMALSLCIITLLSQLLYYWRLCLSLTSRASGDFRREVFVPGLMPALASAVFCGVVSILVPIESWISLIFWSAVSAALYVSVLALFCLNESERADAAQLLRRICPTGQHS